MKPLEVWGNAQMHLVHDDWLMSPFTDHHGLTSVGAGEDSITLALTQMICPVVVPSYFPWIPYYLHISFHPLL